MAHIAHHLEEKERTHDIEIDENITFSDLLLSEAVLSGLHAAGFRRPSPIQLAAIPLGRCGLDLVVQAKSGTGKTCVLAVIALESVSAASLATQVLVVAPTREVAVQVAQVVSTLAVAMPGLRVAAFIGGTKLTDDVSKLKQCQVVVGTPGRLAQLVSLGHLRLECVRLLVLDEADRLLEGNFLDPVMGLTRSLPHNKQVLCLSATYSDAAAAQAERLMRSPSHVRLGRESPALLGVNQLVRRLPPKATAPLRQVAKGDELLRVLSSVTFNQCLVFSGSQLRAESICLDLKTGGWPAAHLTAAQSQTERLAALNALCSHQCRILVATDLAARGLDSPHVNLVVNLDLPPDPATYLHRAGRAGRYGSHGAVVTLVCGPEEWYGARAIATLANVRLLLVGQEWEGSLATHKVKGWRRLGREKVEKEGKAEERKQEEEEGGGGEEKHKQKETGDKDENNSENEKMAREVKEEETEEEQRPEERDRKKREGILKKGKKGVGTPRDGDGVMRLEEVEHLPEEEARVWLRANKPYRKKGGEPRDEDHQENGVLSEGQQRKSQSILRDKTSSSNHTKGEAKCDVDAKIREEENRDVAERKARKKKHPQQKTVKYRSNRSGSDDSEEEEEDEEKENRRGGGTGNKRHPHRNPGNTRDNQARNPGNRNREQGEENNTAGKEIESDGTEDKTSAMSLVNRLWHRPPPAPMSYSQLLSDATHRLDTPASPGTIVRVPPWPVQVEPTEQEVVALEKHLDGMKEEVRERREALDGVRIDVTAVLGALMEGRDVGEVLEQAQQNQAASVLPKQKNTSLEQQNQAASVSPKQKNISRSEQHNQAASVSFKQKNTYQKQQNQAASVSFKQKNTSLEQQKSMSDDIPSSSSSSEYPTSEHSRAHKRHSSSSSDRNNTSTSSTDSKETSISSTQGHKGRKHRTPLEESKYPQLFLGDIRQKHISPSRGRIFSLQSMKDARHSSTQPRALGQDRERPQSATGTRPKEALGGKQREEQESTKNQKSHLNAKNNKKGKPMPSYLAYGVWEPVDKPDQTTHKDDSQAYAGYGKAYEGHDQAYQTYSQTHDSYYDPWYQNYYYQWNQDYNTGYQDYSWRHDDREYQNHNQYRDYWQRYNREFQDNNQGYCQDYNHSHSNHRHYPGTATHQHTPHTSAYVESACKFASMMEYVSTMGRVSLHVAQDYHSRKGHWQKQQGRHSAAPQNVW